PHAASTSFNAPIAPAQPTIASTQPAARRGCRAARRKHPISAASGTVTAVSPKSVTKFQIACKWLSRPVAEPTVPQLRLCAPAVGHPRQAAHAARAGWGCRIGGALFDGGEARVEIDLAARGDFEPRIFEDIAAPPPALFQYRLVAIAQQRRDLGLEQAEGRADPT